MTSSKKQTKVISNLVLKGSKACQGLGSVWGIDWHKQQWEAPLLPCLQTSHFRLAEGMQIILIEISFSYLIRVKRFGKDRCIQETWLKRMRFYGNLNRDRKEIFACLVREQRIGCLAFEQRESQWESMGVECAVWSCQLWWHHNFPVWTWFLTILI